MRRRYLATIYLLPSLAVPGLVSGSIAAPSAHAESLTASMGTWTITGAMTLGRGGDTATRLQDGRVLVAGGQGSYDPAVCTPDCTTASAEIFDPRKRTWSRTGDMLSPRSNHAAVLLLDGRVLVVGGLDIHSMAATAELFDPRTGHWSLAAAPASPRSNPFAELLPSGKVVLVGGLMCQFFEYGEGCGWPVLTVEIYDPTTNAWAASSSIPLNYVRTVTTLSDGRVFVVGDDGAAIYTPETGTWVLTAPMAEPYSGGQAVTLQDGRVLLAGGCCFAQNQHAQIYDPAHNVWSATTPMLTDREGETATLLANGQVLVVGGDNMSGTIADAELYDPGSGEWHHTCSLNYARTHHTATLLATGQVLVAGGGSSSVNLNVADTAEIYTPSTGTGPSRPCAPINVVAVGGNRSVTVNWSPQWDGGSPVTGYSVTVLPGGRSVDVPATATSATLTELPDDHSYSFIVTAHNAVGDSPASALTNPAMPEARGPGIWSSIPTSGSYGWSNGQVMAMGLRDGRVFVTDGAIARILDPVTGIWQSAGTLPIARTYFAATVLPSDKVLVVGGGWNCKIAPATGCLLQSAEIYDPSTNAWSEAAQMHYGHISAQVVVLTGGQILVAGGYTCCSASGAFTTDAEMYDPTTNTWTSIAPTQESHGEGGTLTALADGRALLAGGNNDGRAEVYDSITNTWVAGGQMSTSRYGAAASLLPNGDVLITGGLGTNGILRSAETYSPRSNKWTSAGQMSVPRWMQSQALIGGRYVLVVGGDSTGQNIIGLSSAELYDTQQHKWLSAGDMAVGRLGASAVVLSDSQVMVVGGGTFGCCPSTGFVPAAELYTVEMIGYATPTA